MNDFTNEITILTKKNATEITQWLSTFGGGTMAKGIDNVYQLGQSDGYQLGQLDGFLLAVPLLKQELKYGMLIGAAGTVVVGGTAFAITQIVKKIKQKKNICKKNEIDKYIENQTNDMEEQS